MNDLEELIRGSLAEHATAAPADDTLADRVAGAGRRIRRNRRIGVAVLGVALVAGLAMSLPQLTRTSAPIAATPSPSPTTSTTASPTESSSPDPTPSTTLVRPSWDPTATTRDVSTVGEVISNVTPTGEDRRTRANFFASPSGKFWCTISTEFASCDGQVDMPGVTPSRAQLGCDDGAVQGVELNGPSRAAWYCGSDQTQYPQLNDVDGFGRSVDGTLWWDADFGQTRADLHKPASKLAVLPYGKTLTAGDFRCTTATTGVTCTNTRTNHGFRISQSAVKLY